MNTIKYILLLILVVEVSGCKKFLDRDVEDKTRGTTIDYTNLNAMYSPVSGVYRTAEGDNPGLVHWMVPSLEPILSAKCLEALPRVHFSLSARLIFIITENFLLR